MPTYTYQCSLCGHSFEKFHAMTATPVQECPRQTCAGPVVKLIGAGAGSILKGSGFYQTDYKKSGGAEKCSTCPSAGRCEA